MKTDYFDYILPPELIAQRPADPRDSSRLLVLDRRSETIEHRIFNELPEILKPGDLLVFNNSKVFKARLSARINESLLEIFLLRESEPGIWEALAKPGRKLHAGGLVILPGKIPATVVSKTPEGVVSLKTPLAFQEMLDLSNIHGEIPIPPYISDQPVSLEAYQTVYADPVGSVAAPTAGLHFTERVLRELDTRGIEKVFITLHVGIGTFMPIREESLEKHVMHEEYFSIPEKVWESIERAKREKRRVIAVGTTTLRALESKKGASKTSIFITPGYTFTVADALITNFHLPRSTLLVLVSAFAGTDYIKKAYSEAIQNKYRFYSFGDSMFIQ